ncbi:MAG: hypothetical protein KAX30_03530 [Candidatus Atribacteria bacterium]|nr:hypothetical protein [Candidatus Atribacteria bacterium]
MAEKGPLNGTKKKLKEIKEKYKIDEFPTDILELEKIRKKEEDEFIGKLDPGNMDYVIVTDEAKRDGELIGVRKEEEKEGEQKNLYSTSKELRGILGDLEEELSYTERAFWHSYESEEKAKKVKKHREVKNDE